MINCRESERRVGGLWLHLWGSLILLGPAALSGLIFGGFKPLVEEVPD